MIASLCGCWMFGETVSIRAIVENRKWMGDVAEHSSDRERTVSLNLIILAALSRETETEISACWTNMMLLMLMFANLSDAGRSVLMLNAVELVKPAADTATSDGTSLPVIHESDEHGLVDVCLLFHYHHYYFRIVIRQKCLHFLFSGEIMAYWH